MLRGHAYCLIDEATGVVLRVSSTPIDPPSGCSVCGVQADQLPPEVQALAKTPTHFEIEAAFIGGGRAAFLADDEKAIRIEVRETTEDVVEEYHAKILARRLETWEPSGLLETAIVGLVRLAGAQAVAKAAIVGLQPQPKPARKTAKKGRK